MKLHIVSAPINLNSGFAIVAKNIATGLKKLGYEVTISGLKQADVPAFYYGIENMPILATPTDEITQLILNIQKVNPDIILNIFQSDSGEWSGHAYAGFEAEKLLGRKVKCYWYTPIEGLGLSYNALRDLTNFTSMGGIVVAQCKWGQREMSKEGIESHVIYHGVDEKIYKPLDLNGKEKIRFCYYSTDVGQVMSNQRLLCERGCYKCSGNIDCSYYKEEEISLLRCFDSKERKWGLKKIKITDLVNEDKGKFIYLVVAQNIGVRKRQERVLKAYSIMINNNRRLKDRTMLYIHTDPLKTGMYPGLNLIEVVNKLEIGENIVFTSGEYGSSLTDECMNILFNKANCHLSGSSGEGYMISTNYSTTVGIPTIGPRNTSFIELIEEEKEDKNKKTIGPRGLLANGLYQYIIDGSERFLVNEEDLALKMKEIFVKDGDREKIEKNCLEFAKNFTWEKIVKQWDELFKLNK